MSKSQMKAAVWHKAHDLRAEKVAAPMMCG